MLLEAIARTFERRAIKYDPIYPGDPGLADLWGRGMPSRSGIVVNEKVALTHSSIWRAVNFRSAVMGRIPIFVFRLRDDDSKERLRDHPLSSILRKTVNRDLSLSAFTFWASRENQVLTWGNSYAFIRRDAKGMPLSLWPHPPDLVTVDMNDAGEPFYVFHGTREADKTYGPGEVLHFKGPSPDGLLGWSRIRIFRESIGQTLAAQQFGAAYFGQGARMGITVTTQPGFKVSDAKLMKESIAEQVSGPENWHKPLVLPGADKIVQTSIPPEDSQFLGTMEWGVAEAARIVGVPLVFMMLPNSEPRANAEQDTLNFKTTEIDPECENFAQEINQKLLLPSERESMFVEHNLDSLLRGDFKSRMEGYHLGLMDGLFDRDDCLRKENMDPIGEENGGTIRTVPVNSMNLKALIGQEMPPAAVTPPAKVGEPPARSIDWLSVYEPLFIDASDRLLAKERKSIEAMTGKTKSHSDLDADIRSYYAGHDDAVYYVLAPVLRSLAGRDGDSLGRLIGQRYCIRASSTPWPQWLNGKAREFLVGECRAAITLFKECDDANQS